jgi:hypothetical protein
VRTADETELKPSSDSVMGISPSCPFFLLQIPSLLANMSIEFACVRFAIVEDPDAKKSSPARIDRPLAALSVISNSHVVRGFTDSAEDSS